MATQDDLCRLDTAESWAKEQIMLLENKLKEDNLKFWGFPEDLHLSPDIRFFLVIWLFNALDLDGGVALFIDKAYRLGLASNHSSHLPRDILAKIPDSRTRAAILKRSHSAEGLIFQG